ncbi:hypothetical protein GBAR_LOCUS17366 [Geodia barretti]|uniref:Uncharacterized protein n=1 Tax=Geodia barretti TaxID=519541 RepID=A0AA35WVS0_GEOBA|nr:hypothetical protein GBAR_LOCUS17366 [Geodia barretti]
MGPPLRRQCQGRVPGYQGFLASPAGGRRR